MKIEGTFEISMKAEPPHDVEGGVSLSRATFEKVFSGDLTATSRVEMLAARTPIEGSAGYVAIERIVGTVAGKTGSFVVVHTGLMNRGARSLVVRIVPGSGTAELAGIDGTMDIHVTEGKHHYEGTLSFH